jgi:hypothetical protein
MIHVVRTYYRGELFKTVKVDDCGYSLYTVEVFDIANGMITMDELERKILREGRIKSLSVFNTERYLQQNVPSPDYHDLLRKSK